MNFDKAHRKVEELLDSEKAAEDEAVDLMVLMMIADGAPVDDGPTQAEAQAELRRRGLL